MPISLDSTSWISVARAEDRGKRRRRHPACRAATDDDDLERLPHSLTPRCKEKGAPYRIRRAQFCGTRALLDAIANADGNSAIVCEPGTREQQALVCDLLSQYRFRLQQVLRIDKDVPVLIRPQVQRSVDCPYASCQIGNLIQQSDWLIM